MGFGEWFLEIEYEYGVYDVIRRDLTVLPGALCLLWGTVSSLPRDWLSLRLVSDTGGIIAQHLEGKK